MSIDLFRKASQDVYEIGNNASSASFWRQKCCFRDNRVFFFLFPWWKRNNPESIRDKLIRWWPFPISEVFLQRISETTLLFERPKDEVLAACHANTPEALCSILHSLKQIEPDYRIEQGAWPCFLFPMPTKKLYEIRNYTSASFSSGFKTLAYMKTANENASAFLSFE